MPDVISQLEQIVRDVSGVASDLDPEADLVGRRLIKSVMLLEIISQIEEVWEIEVTAQDVYAGHFVSMRAMADFIQSRA
jgi:acyl carrier protein